MSEALESLFQTTNVKAFAKQFKELQEEWGEPRTFVREAARYLAPRLYQPYYDEDTPHCLPGLDAALEVAPLCPEEQAWWPFVQQAWHAANTRKRSPLPWEEIEPVSEGTADERWEKFAAAVGQEDFEAAFAVARGFCGDGYEDFRGRLTRLALYDSAQGGLGFLYTRAISRLAAGGETPDPGVLAPAIHFLALSPRDCTLSSRVQEFSTGQEAAASGRHLDLDAYEALEQSVLFSDELDEALEGAADAASLAGVDALFEGLLLAGTNAISNARQGRWVRPVRACLVGWAARQDTASAPADDRLKAALYAAGLLHRASLRSRHGTANRDLEEVARRLCPLDTFNTLRSVVSHSDPYASATAVYAILGMGDDKQLELCRSLATLAAKNDGRMGRGYDLLLVKAAVEAYADSQLPAKDRFLSGCAFFLGRLQKDYELFGAYGV